MGSIPNTGKRRVKLRERRDEIEGQAEPQAEPS
jgi:hypothetical protein